MNREEVLILELNQYAQYKNLYLCIDSLTSEIGRRSVRNYLKENNIKKVILYGAGVLGRLTSDVIEKSGVCEVIGVMDKSGTTAYGFREFLSLEELTTVDYDRIIITPLRSLTPISKYLKKNGIKNYCFVSEMLEWEGRNILYENDIYF